MPPTITADRERKHATQLLERVLAEPARVFVLHYALQQLRLQQQELTAPVAAIAIQRLDPSLGAPRVFSIKAEADIAGVDLATPLAPEPGNPPPAPNANHPDRTILKRLEYNVLFHFNDFLADHPDALFVHWYMRDEKFGFAALEHRYRKVLADLNQTLFGPRSAATAAPYGYGAGPASYPVRIAEDRKIDLALVIRGLYRTPALGLRELADRNGLSHAELIPGDREPDAFERGNHARLQWSTSAKARLIAQIVMLAADGRLQLDRPRPAADGPAVPRIFINYRREDTEAAAGRLNDRLSAAYGHDHVFFDTDDIPAGLDFVEQLNRQIADCDVFLAVIGRRWADVADAGGRRRLADPDDFVRREIKAALARGIPVIPVLVDGTPMPSQVQLPDDLQPLTRRHALELRNSQFGADVDRLVAKIADTMRFQAHQARAR